MCVCVCVFYKVLKMIFRVTPVEDNCLRMTKIWGQELGKKSSVEDLKNYYSWYSLSFLHFL